MRSSSIDSGSPPTASAALGVRRRRLHHREAPALGRRGREVHPRSLEQLHLSLLAHVPVHANALAEPASADLGLERGTVVALAGHVEDGLGHVLEHVEQDLDVLVALEPAEVEKGGLGSRSPGPNESSSTPR